MSRTTSNGRSSLLVGATGAPSRTLKKLKVPVTRRKLSNYNRQATTALTSGKRSVGVELPDRTLGNASRLTNLEYILSGKVSVGGSQLAGEIPNPNDLSAVMCGVNRPVQGPITVVSSTNSGNAVVTFAAASFVSVQYDNVNNTSTNPFYAQGRQFFLYKYKANNTATPEALPISTNGTNTITCVGTFASAAAAGDICYICEVHEAELNGSKAPALKVGTLLRMALRGLTLAPDSPIFHRYEQELSADGQWPCGTWFAAYATPLSTITYADPTKIYWDRVSESNSSQATFVKSGNPTAVSFASNSNANSGTPSPLCLVGDWPDRDVPAIIMVGDSRFQTSAPDGYALSGVLTNADRFLDVSLFGYSTQLQGIPVIRAHRSGELLRAQINDGNLERLALAEFTDWAILEGGINDLLGGLSASIIQAQLTAQAAEYRAMGNKIAFMLPYGYATESTGGAGRFLCDPNTQSPGTYWATTVTDLITWATTTAISEGIFDKIIDPRPYVEYNIAGTYQGVFKPAKVLASFTTNALGSFSTHMRINTPSDLRQYWPMLAAVKCTGGWSWGSGRYFGAFHNVSSNQLVVGNSNPTYGSIMAYTVTNATNASPIVVTTSVAHGLSDGEPVAISGTTGNTAANVNPGYAKVTGYSATTFALYSNASLTTPVAGNGAFGGTPSMFPLHPSGATFDVLAPYGLIDTSPFVHASLQAAVDIGDPTTGINWKATLPPVYE